MDSLNKLKDNFLNPLNPYRVKEGKMPFKIYADEHPEDDPVMDARQQSVIFTTLFRNPAAKKVAAKKAAAKKAAADEPDTLAETTSVPPELDELPQHLELESTLPPPAHGHNPAEKSAESSRTTERPIFPRPTLSPTKDPHYIYRNPPARKDHFVLSEYILGHPGSGAGTEKPKIRNAFEEGRYEFRPSRFRQRNPILVSGSALFGSEEQSQVKTSRQADDRPRQPQPVNLESILIRLKNVSGDEDPSRCQFYESPFGPNVYDSVLISEF
jgi:hypothetical protein